MKRFIIALSILMVFILILFFFGFQRLVNVALNRFLKQIDTESIQINFATIHYSFPLRLRILDITVVHDNFFFSAPQADLALNWDFFVGKESLVIASINQAEFKSNSKNFMQKVEDLRFQLIPDFEIDIKELTISENNFTDVPIPICMQKKSDILFFQINHSQFFMSGTFVSEKEIQADYRLTHSKIPIKGHLAYTFQDNQLEGTIQSEMDMTFAASLDHLDDGIIFRNLKILTASKPQESISFLGQGKLWFEPDRKVYLQGEINNEEFQEPFQLELELEPEKNIQEINGKLHIESKQFDLNALTAFTIYPGKSSFILHVLPESYFAENPLRGEVKGTFKDRQITMEFNTNPGEWTYADFSAYGVIKGDACISLETFNVDGQFSGDWVHFQDYQLNQAQLQFQYSPNQFLFHMTGTLFSGVLTLDGQYLDEILTASGTLTNGKIDQILGEDFPLKGSFSSTLEIRKTKTDNPSLMATIQDGSLFWDDFFVGDHLSGVFHSQGDTVSISKISLKNEEGIIEGEVVKEPDRIDGKVYFKAFPFIYTVSDQALSISMNGSGEFQYSGDTWNIQTQIHAPKWDYGEWGGSDLTFQGKLTPSSILIENCHAFFLGGEISIEGEILPYIHIDLIGSLSNLKFPDNAYEFQGIIKNTSLKVEGPWENVSFQLSGEGEELRYQGQPLGESFQVVVEGESELPMKNEKVGFEKFVNPEILTKGIIYIKQAYFEQNIGNEYTISGGGDLEAQLDIDEKIWLIQSPNLYINFNKMFNFTGFFHGTYQKDQIEIQDLKLTEDEKNMTLVGVGLYDVKEKSIQGKITGEFDTFLTLPDYRADVVLNGETEIGLSGTVNEPWFDGWVQINQGKVSYEGNDLIQLERMTGRINGMEIIISDTFGQWLGFNFTAEGSINQNGADLTFFVSGENDLFGQEKYLQGNWGGKIILTGEYSHLQAQGIIQIKDGVIDTTLFDKTQGTSEIFQTLDESFKNIPLKLKLVLQTDENFRVRSRFIDLTLFGEVTIDNTGDDLETKGRLDVIDGEYDLVMRTVPLQGYVIFGDYFEFIPQVHLEGRIEVERYDIILRADGPLDNYEMKLQSEPQLSQEEILSLLFVGDKEAYQSLDSLELEPHLLSAFRFFLGMKGTGLEKVLFIDSIELVAPNQQNEDFYGIELKKDLGENASISYTHDLNGGENSTWNFELDLSKEWSFKSELGTNGEYGWELEFTTKF